MDSRHFSNCATASHPQDQLADCYVIQKWHLKPLTGGNDLQSKSRFCWSWQVLEQRVLDVSIEPTQARPPWQIRPFDTALLSKPETSESHSLVSAVLWPQWFKTRLSHPASFRKSLPELTWTGPQSAYCCVECLLTQVVPSWWKQTDQQQNWAESSVHTLPYCVAPEQIMWPEPCWPPFLTCEPETANHA